MFDSTPGCACIRSSATLVHSRTPTRLTLTTASTVAVVREVKGRRPPLMPALLIQWLTVPSFSLANLPSSSTLADLLTCRVARRACDAE
eukprot:scaffold29379_cov54-Phaeocystis_antarctica.AAC.1